MEYFPIFFRQKSHQTWHGHAHGNDQYYHYYAQVTSSDNIDHFLLTKKIRENVSPTIVMINIIYH